MLRDNFLPLPSIRTLQRYMKKLSPQYGFQKNVFEMLKEKAPHMEEAERHGENPIRFRCTKEVGINPLKISI